MNLLSCTSICYSITIQNQILSYIGKILQKKNISEAYKWEQIQPEQTVYDIGMTLCDFLHKVK